MSAIKLVTNRRICCQPLNYELRARVNGRIHEDSRIHRRCGAALP